MSETGWWNKVIAGLIVVLVTAGLLFVVFLIPTILAWLLWNWVMAGVFGLPVLSIWHMFGLLFLISIIRGFTKAKDPRD